MRITHIIFSVPITFILITSTVSAETKASYAKHTKDYHQTWENKVNELYQELGLTSAQQEKLKENKKNYLEKKSDIHQKIRKAKEELNQELYKSPLDMNKMQKIHAWIKELKSAKENLRFESILEVRKILNAEQFEKFMAIKTQHRTNWKK